MSPAPTAFQPASAPGLSEVRYSYKDMMQELKSERSASTYSMEKLDQTEIEKLFKAKKLRRDKDKL